MTKRILMAAGGTGGHLFPARATAEVLSKRGWSVRLVTDERGARHAGDFPGEGVYQIAASSPFVKNPIKLIKALLSLRRGIAQTRKIVREFDPDVIAGFGGYPAFPAMVVAGQKHVPAVIHEQNAVLGRVNRMFAKNAFAVASGFERLDKLSENAKHVVIGNPVREKVLAEGQVDYAPVGSDGRVNLLVVGGSLGARILSETVPAAIAQLPESTRKKLRVVQQTRVENLDEARRVYTQAGVQAECEAFFDNMGKLYANAQLVISRAGASSVAEIAALGRPALFVPLAIAMDDHQTANAEDIVNAGGAISLNEESFTPAVLADLLNSLIDDQDRLRQMASSARSRGRPDAHIQLADLIEDAARRQTDE